MTHNYLAQDTEITLIKQLLPYLSSRNFLDVGAEKGEFALAMVEQGLTGVLFEPMPRHLATLQKIISQYAGVKLYQFAITNTDSKQKFHIATGADGNELDYYHSLQKGDTPGIFTHSTSFDVTCRSLQSLTENEEIPTSVGVLKTDTEGNDLNVLRGLGTLRPEVIICEYFTDGLYNGWPEGRPEAVIDHLQDLGYTTFIATTRCKGLELVTLGKSLYSEKQWGNLFFFRNDFYVEAKHIIAKCIANSEIALQEKLEKLNLELEEKEKVIQELIVENKRLVANLTHIPETKNWLLRGLFGRK